MHRGWTPRSRWPERLILAVIAVAVAGGAVYALRSKTPEAAAVKQPAAASAVERPVGKPDVSAGQPVEILRELKLPDGLPDGSYVFRNESTFADFLGKSYKRYMKYNSLNFSRQMAIIFSVTKTSPNYAFESIHRTDSELIVRVQDIKTHRPVPQVMTQRVLGVVVKKSDLPVRFERVEVCRD